MKLAQLIARNPLLTRDGILDAYYSVIRTVRLLPVTITVQSGRQYMYPLLEGLITLNGKPGKIKQVTDIIAGTILDEQPVGDYLFGSPLSVRFTLGISPNTPVKGGVFLANGTFTATEPDTVFIITAYVMPYPLAIAEPENTSIPDHLAVLTVMKAMENYHMNNQSIVDAAKYSSLYAQISNQYNINGVDFMAKSNSPAFEIVPYEL